MPKDNFIRLNLSSVSEPAKPFSGNDYDAIPSISYAITAYHRAKGKPGSKYWDAYQDAINHISGTFGKEAAEHTQEAAVSTANSDNPSQSLLNYSRSMIAAKAPVNKYVKNLLVSSAEGNAPLDKLTYAFDLPDQKLQNIQNLVKK